MRRGRRGREERIATGGNAALAMTEKEVRNGMIVYIAERRRAAGMTQEDLSARLGVDRSAVALWETGARTPGTERLPALAEALGCGIGELFAPPAAREETA